MNKYEPTKGVVTGFQLQLLSNKDIVALSVVKVNETTLYKNSLPRMNGLNDTRLGTCDRQQLCGTCQNDIFVCSGHIGHIELPVPCIHSAFVSDVLKILRCVCFKCLNLVGNVVVKNKQEDTLTAWANVLKTKKACSMCEFVFPKWSIANHQIKREFTGDGTKQFTHNPKTSFVGKEYLSWAKNPVTTSEILDFLRSIPAETYSRLGFNIANCHPKDFVMQFLVVPPTIIRPAITFSESSRTRGQDDLTNKLQEILKQTKKIRKGKGGTDTSVQSEILFGMLAGYLSQDTATKSNSRSVRRSGTQIKDIHTRLKGKSGRVRGNLMGKRVNFSARTVISPDCNLDVNEIGIPVETAHTLTFTETVTPLNFKQLSARVLEGTRSVLGAKSVIQKRNGNRRVLLDHDLITKNQNIQLQMGDEVERYMQNGDIVLFNRQPSLRKTSIMSHYVKIMPQKTVSLNLVCTTPYNGDFDGDEMNLHMLQDYMAVTEAKLLMNVSQQFLNAQNNRPTMGIVQDALLGSYLLTSADCLFSKTDVFQLVMVLRYPRRTELPLPAFFRPSEKWTGKQLFSYLLPPTFHYCKKKEEGETVLVVSGELLTGQLCKQTLGTASNSIIHLLCKYYGNQTCLEFMSDLQRLVNSFIQTRGFSIGLDDCVAVNAATHLKIHKAIQSCLGHVGQLVTMGKDVSAVSADRVELEATRALSKMLSVSAALVNQNARLNNSLLSMVTAGSKGSLINIAQITGCVGQQSIDGRRAGITTRPISWIDPNSTDPRYQGFVTNSYIQGLNPMEMFFHTMGGREGIVDTSVKTADTGYLQRKLMKSMESLCVSYDGTVRDSEKQILEFRYGGDGNDASLLERVSLSSSFQLAVPSKWLDTHDIKKSLQTALEMLSPEGGTCYLPVNLTLLLEQHSSAPVPVTEVLPRAIFPSGLLPALRPSVSRPSAVLPAALTNEEALAAILKFLDTLDMCSTTFLKVHAVQVLLDYPKPIPPEVLDEYEKMVQRGIVEPGEMVGTLAASSIGEPTTQLTLNTFHLAGVGEKNVSQGVPRIKELFDARTNSNFQLTYLYIVPSHNKDESFVQQLAASIPLTSMTDITVTSDILYEPSFEIAAVDHPEDAFLVQTYSSFYPEPEAMSSYVIRIELNKPLLQSKNLGIYEVRLKFEALFPNPKYYYITHSEPASPIWVFRIRLLRIPTFSQNRLEAEKAVCYNFWKYTGRNLLVCGVPNITSATVLKDKEEFYIRLAGLNLRELWQLEGVDWTRSYSNNMFETLEVLGIETVAVLLVKEITSVLSFDGGRIDPRHIILVANVMTHSGKIMALNRHGLNHKVGINPLVKCTFEETVDILYNATKQADKFAITGVSDALMCGTAIRGGTGAFETFFKNTEDANTCTDAKKTNNPKTNKKVKGGVHITKTEYVPEWNFTNSAIVDKKRKQELKTPEEEKMPERYKKFYKGHVRPVCSPTNPVFSPTSPVFSPTSPSYTPGSPLYTLGSPLYTPGSPAYTPGSPAYTPDSPLYYPDSPVLPSRPPASPVLFSADMYGLDSPVVTALTPDVVAMSPLHLPASNIGLSPPCLPVVSASSVCFSYCARPLNNVTKAKTTKHKSSSVLTGLDQYSPVRQSASSSNPYSPTKSPNQYSPIRQSASSTPYSPTRPFSAFSESSDLKSDGLAIASPKLNNVLSTPNIAPQIPPTLAGVWNYDTVSQVIENISSNLAQRPDFITDSNTLPTNEEIEDVFQSFMKFSHT